MIVVAGEALVDVVIAPDGSVEAVLGGAPFNTARACGRLGVDTAFVGAISTDRFGAQLRAQLVDDGVSTRWAHAVDAPTTLAAAELDDSGTAAYRFYIAGTSAPALPSAPPLDGVSALFSGGLGLVLQPMADTIETMFGARPVDCLGMIDVNCRPPVIGDRVGYLARLHRIIRSADVVKASDEDLRYVYPDATAGEAARRLLAEGARVVLVTAGSDHVDVHTADRHRAVPVEPVDVVDTIGAGDSFGAGFLSWWTLTGRSKRDLIDIDDLASAVAAANTVAGIACTRRGAEPPWRAELPTGWASEPGTRG